METYLPELDEKGLARQLRAIRGSLDQDELLTKSEEWLNLTHEVGGYCQVLNGKV